MVTSFPMYKKTNPCRNGTYKRSSHHWTLIGNRSHPHHINLRNLYTSSPIAKMSRSRHFRFKREPHDVANELLQRNIYTEHSLDIGAVFSKSVCKKTKYNMPYRVTVANRLDVRFQNRAPGFNSGSRRKLEIRPISSRVGRQRTCGAFGWKSLSGLLYQMHSQLVIYS